MAHISESELKDIAQQQYTVGGPQPGEVYRHYKGGLYVIVARSIMEGTLEPLVTYRSNAKGTFRTRTLENFTELVAMPETRGCRAVQRFRMEKD